MVRWNLATNTATLVEVTSGREALIVRVTGALWGLVVDDSGLYAWHDLPNDARDILRISR